MIKRNKVYSYDSLTASAIIGGPLALFVMSLWNYSVLKKFIKTKKDSKELLSKLVVPTILLVMFIGALFSISINPIFYLGINIGLIVVAASIWKSMLSSYEKGGGKAFGGVVSIGTLVVSLVVSVAAIVGIYYARFDAVGEKPSVLQVLEISINTKFDTSKYNQLITEYTANERQAIGLLEKLTTSSEEQGKVYIEDNKTLWQKKHGSRRRAICS